MFNTLQHLRALTRAYESGQITEQGLIKEWSDIIYMLYLRLCEAAFFLVKKGKIEA
jgi:hypothetical protein